jgi:hypothetical protein
MKSYLTIFWLNISWSVYAMAGIIHVPADTASIQGGIFLANTGDTVLVADSNYYENINFLGKAITVASLFIIDGDTNHINNTVIDGSQPSHPDSGSVVLFVSGEDTTSVLCGFTITGGTGTKFQVTIPIPPYNLMVRGGGGILVNNSGATIFGNRIIQNSLDDVQVQECAGGGIAIGSPGNTKWSIIENNLIQNNACRNGSLSNSGGGLSIVSNAMVRGNTIRLNQALSNTPQAVGGGLHFEGGDSVIVIDNILDGNVAATNSTSRLGVGGGAYFMRKDSAFVQVIRNIFAFNEVKSSYWSGGSGVGFDTVNGEVLFVNNIIHNNFFSGSNVCHGGGIYITHSEVEIINNTFKGNIATYGGGVCNRYSEETVYTNNILWNDSSYIGPREIEIIKNAGEQDPEIAYCDIQGGWNGVGNINADPMFLDPANQWFCLHEQSPCVDSGDVNILDPEDPFIPGYALWPARGTIISDIGAFGGPDANCWDDPITGLEKKSERHVQIPNTVLLYQNYPNPFNPATTIEFSLPQTRYVTLKIYNILGEEVATLVSDRLTAGKYKYDWNANGLASGVYLYFLEAGVFKRTKKLILLK